MTAVEGSGAGSRSTPRKTNRALTRWATPRHRVLEASAGVGRGSVVFLTQVGMAGPAAAVPAPDCRGWKVEPIRVVLSQLPSVPVCGHLPECADPNGQPNEPTRIPDVDTYVCPVCRFVWTVRLMPGTRVPRVSLTTVKLTSCRLSRCAVDDDEPTLPHRSLQPSSRRTASDCRPAHPRPLATCPRGCKPTRRPETDLVPKDIRGDVALHDPV